MLHSADSNASTAQLLQHLEKGATGKLVLGNGNEELCVYLMNGEILSAEAADDAWMLLRRLTAAGYIADNRSAELAKWLALGGNTDPASATARRG